MEACSYRADSSLPSGVLSLSLAALVSTRRHCACSSKQGRNTWKAAQASLMNGSSAGGPVNQNDQEGNVVDDIAVLLSNCERLKSMIDSSSSSGVGPDMRNRVEHLLKRVGTLKQSAELAACVAGGRVPSQLIASLKALQREHGSIENIVRLATQAGPVLIQQDSDLSVVAPKGVLSMDYKPDGVDVELAQKQDDETPVEVLSGPKYVMSTPLNEDSFKLTAVRAEIERRVMDQLIKKQGLQSIFDSRCGVRKDNETKLIESQCGEQESSWCEAKKPWRQERHYRQRLVEAQLVDYSTPSDPMYSNNKAQFDTGQREMENARTIPLEVHEQMVKKFEVAVFDLREQLSEVTDDLRKREDTVLAFKELMNEQSRLSEKMDQLSCELMKRLTEEQLNHTLGKLIFDMEEDLKRTQSQLVSLRSESHNKDKMLVGFQEEQERIRQELQAGILSLEGRLRQREVMYEGFNPQSALTELGSFKVKLSALQEGRILEQTQMADWQAKIEHFERLVWNNEKQLKKLTSEVERRMTGEEMKNVLNKVLDAVEKQSTKLQEHIERFGAEQVRTASSLGLLQREWSAHRSEFQIQIEDLKYHLLCLERTQNQGVLTGVLNINERLSHMQEEEKRQRTLISEAQQQLVALEGKGLDMLRKMSEDAKVQKQEVLEEVQKLVDELLKSSSVRQRDGNEAAVSIKEFNATLKDVGQTGDLVNPPSSYVLSSELSAAISQNEQHEAALQGGSEQVREKGTASLEAFFSVMGQLIREELKRMDRTSDQTSPLAKLHKSREPTQDGESTDGTILLRYNSSWKKAFIHFCADNQGWTEVPGVPMQEASNCLGKSCKEFRIKAARLEFVVTDGQGNWDRASNGHNYLVEKPGIFELGAGVLKFASTL